VRLCRPCVCARATIMRSDVQSRCAQETPDSPLHHSASLQEANSEVTRCSSICCSSTSNRLFPSNPRRCSATAAVVPRPALGLRDMHSNRLHTMCVRAAKLPIFILYDHTISARPNSGQGHIQMQFTSHLSTTT
jgi:hypothetical protein